MCIRDSINGDMFWEKRLGILDDVKAGRKKIAYGIGIGYPQADKERWQTDETELAIGAGNGDTLTTLNEKDPNWVDTHIDTGKTVRKIKIVNIKENTEAVDPYGNLHPLPLTSDIKINTQKIRKINVTEIK